MAPRRSWLFGYLLGMMKKKLYLLLILPAIAAVCLIFLFVARGRKLDVYYVTNNPCETCHEYENFLSAFQQALGQDAAHCKVTKVYLLTEQGKATFDSLCQKLAIPREDRIPPMLIVGSQYITGLQNIETNGCALYLAEKNNRKYSPGASLGAPAATTAAHTAAASAGPDDSYLLYFTTELCGACKDTKEYLATLPALVDATDGQRTVHSRIVLDVRSTTDYKNMTLLTNLYEKWNVPEDERTVPVVFYASGWLRGADAIRGSLMKELAAGRALHYTGP
jgi:hypothetical protein